MQRLFLIVKKDLYQGKKMRICKNTGIKLYSDLMSFYKKLYPNIALRGGTPATPYRGNNIKIYKILI